MTTEAKHHIELTQQQRDDLKRVCGIEAEALELNMEELEERIAPWLTTGWTVWRGGW
jgi:hypothetical protein